MNCCTYRFVCEAHKENSINFNFAVSSWDFLDSFLSFSQVRNMMTLCVFVCCCCCCFMTSRQLELGSAINTAKLRFYIYCRENLHEKFLSAAAAAWLAT